MVGGIGLRWDVAALLGGKGGGCFGVLGCIMGLSNYGDGGENGVVGW